MSNRGSIKMESSVLNSTFDSISVSVMNDVDVQQKLLEIEDSLPAMPIESSSVLDNTYTTPKNMTRNLSYSFQGDKSILPENSFSNNCDNRISNVFFKRPFQSRIQVTKDYSFQKAFEDSDISTTNDSKFLDHLPVKKRKKFGKLVKQKPDPLLFEDAFSSSLEESKININNKRHFTARSKPRKSAKDDDFQNAFASSSDESDVISKHQRFTLNNIRESVRADDFQNAFASSLDESSFSNNKNRFTLINKRKSVRADDFQNAFASSLDESSINANSTCESKYERESLGESTTFDSSDTSANSVQSMRPSYENTLNSNAELQDTYTPKPLKSPLQESLNVISSDKKEHDERSSLKTLNHTDINCIAKNHSQVSTSRHDSQDALELNVSAYSSDNHTSNALGLTPGESLNLVSSDKKEHDGRPSLKTLGRNEVKRIAKNHSHISTSRHDPQDTLELNVPAYSSDSHTSNDLGLTPRESLNLVSSDKKEHDGRPSLKTLGRNEVKRIAKNHSQLSTSRHDSQDTLELNVSAYSSDNHTSYALGLTPRESLNLICSDKKDENKMPALETGNHSEVKPFAKNQGEISTSRHNSEDNLQLNVSGNSEDTLTSEFLDSVPQESLNLISSVKKVENGPSLKTRNHTQIKPFAKNQFEIFSSGHDSQDMQLSVSANNEDCYLNFIKTSNPMRSTHRESVNLIRSDKVQDDKRPSLKTCNPTEEGHFVKNRAKISTSRHGSFDVPELNVSIYSQHSIQPLHKQNLSCNSQCEVTLTRSNLLGSSPPKSFNLKHSNKKRDKTRPLLKIPNNDINSFANNCLSTEISTSGNNSQDVPELNASAYSVHSMELSCENNLNSNSQYIDTHTSNLESTAPQEHLIHSKKFDNARLPLNDLNRTEVHNFAKNCPFSELRPKRNKAAVNEHVSNELLHNENMKNVVRPLKRLSKNTVLPKPKRWVTKRLYDYLFEKLLPIHGIRYRLEAVDLVMFMVEKVTEALKKTEGYDVPVEELKIELARRKIVETNRDFFNFVKRFLDDDFYLKSVPSSRPTLEKVVIRYTLGTMDDKIIYED